MRNKWYIDHLGFIKYAGDESRCLSIDITSINLAHGTGAEASASFTDETPQAHRALNAITNPNTYWMSPSTS